MHRFMYTENYKISYLHPDEMWEKYLNFNAQNRKIPQLTTSLLLGQHQAEDAQRVAIELYFV